MSVAACSLWELTCPPFGGLQPPCQETRKNSFAPYLRKSSSRSTRSSITVHNEQHRAHLTLRAAGIRPARDRNQSRAAGLCANGERGGEVFGRVFDAHGIVKGAAAALFFHASPKRGISKMKSQGSVPNAHKTLQSQNRPGAKN